MDTDPGERSPHVFGEVMRESFVVIPATWSVERVANFLEGLYPSHLIIRETTDTGEERYYLVRVGDVFDHIDRFWHEASTNADGGDLPPPTLGTVVGQAGLTPCPIVAPDEPVDDNTYYAVVVDEDRVVGIFEPHDRHTTGLPIEKGVGDFNAFPRLDAPDQVQPLETFEVTVGFRATADENLQDISPLAIKNPAPDATVLVVLSADGAEIIGDSFDTLPLKLNKSTIFTCRARETVDEVVLKVMYFYQQQPVGSATRRVPVAKATRRGPQVKPKTTANPCQLSAPTADSAVDLTIQITKDPQPDGMHLSWTILAPNPLIEASGLTTKVEDTRQFGGSIYSSLRTQQFKGLFAHNILRDIGQRITDLMPPEFFTHLRAVYEAIQRPPTLLLLTDEPYIPWELALLDTPLDPSAHPFLAAQTQMGRWWVDEHVVQPPPTAIHVQRMTAVAPNHTLGGGGGLTPLKQALAERAMLAERFGAQSLEATQDELATVIFGEPSPGHLIHFAVHGLSKPDANEQAFFLSDGKQMIPGALMGSYRCGQMPRFHFVFFNACQVGTAGSTLGQAAGFPGTLIERGVQGFLAPLWDVHDTVAYEFATEFYQATLQTKEPVAQVLYNYRKRYKAEESTTPMAYVYYGHPKLRLNKTD